MIARFYQVIEYQLGPNDDWGRKIAEAIQRLAVLAPDAWPVRSDRGLVHAYDAIIEGNFSDRQARALIAAALEVVGQLRARCPGADVLAAAIELSGAVLDFQEALSGARF